MYWRVAMFFTIENRLNATITHFSNIINSQICKISSWPRDGSSEEFLGGLRGPAGQNFGAAACHHNFCKWISCKTGLKLLNWAKTGLKLLKRPAAGDFFWKMTYFQAIFGASWGGYNPPWVGLGGVATPPNPPGGSIPDYIFA